MSEKRSHSGSFASSDGKRPKVDDEKRQEAIRRAREKIAQLKAKKAASANTVEITKTEVNKSDLASLKEHTAAAKIEKSTTEATTNPVQAKGLNVELHPLLSGKPSSSSPSAIAFNEPNPNLIKANRRGFTVNPYLTDISESRPYRELRFNEKGKYIKQAEEIRKEERLSALKSKIEAQKKKAGLEPDHTIGEDRYKVHNPPVVEWWDEPLITSGDYSKINEDAVSVYVQHPVPIMAPWERHLPPPKPMFLTRKEMKRIRRNNRAEKYKDLQDKIKLGLEEAPKPKVKLSNMMAALTNEAIKDPTALEQKVRKEVEERERKHFEDNEARKLTKEQRHEKEQEKLEKDLQKGYYTAIFLVRKLKHPSHKFKVDRNAEQLKLVGTVLYVSEEFVLIIVEGTEKNIKFYKKLMTNRIKWDESITVDDQEIDLTGNKCEVLWEGQLKQFHFKKWSIFRANSEDIALDYLTRFSVESYLREAKTHLKR